MTRPTSIAARAEYLRAELKAIVDALPAYSSANPALTVRAALGLTEMVADLARLVEQPGASRAADVLLKHQGPFFNGAESQCSCGLWVKTGERWAEHVAKLIGAQGE